MCFIAKFLQDICRILNFQNQFTTTYNPHTNGQLERNNISFKEGIHNRVDDHPKKWDLYTSSQNQLATLFVVNASLLILFAVSCFFHRVLPISTSLQCYGEGPSATTELLIIARLSFYFSPFHFLFLWESTLQFTAALRILPLLTQEPWQLRMFWCHATKHSRIL